MPAEAPFLAGVIEGFYGREWSWQARLAYADLLAAAGLNTYLYAPKADACLRRCWQGDWPAQQRAHLQRLGRAYAARGLFWGVGLSPYELYRDYGPQKRERLKRKVTDLADLGLNLLALLFDDMPGDLPDLAARQAEIVRDVCDWQPGLRVLVCPTFYSFDPALEKHFGARPPAYWEELGAGLPAGVDVFWTGNRVCSETISRADIERIVAPLGRPVTLWDNYPVNDGALRSNHLYLRPLAGRAETLRALLKGHLCNPMNQPWLSLPALSGLADLYGDGDSAGQALRRALGEDVAERLARDTRTFQFEGLSGLTEARRSELARQYSSLRGPAAAEVVAWLRGEYEFDPACLTD